ncbi:MAG: GPR endopeptidase [Clostridiaceae bacterium]|nr:GPR endopeptidase [Clostridiaceae bacterium]
MFVGRTDMAIERRDNLDKATASSLKGLECKTSREGDMEITEIHVTDDEASKALGKPLGTYITIDLQKQWQNDDDFILEVAHKLAHYIGPLLPKEGGILAVGLGNRHITADALGPMALEKLIITRHLRTQMPELFSSLREVSGFSPGVMGQTGMEALELVKGTCKLIKPAAVVAVDALTASSLTRLGTSFQISSSGIIPGEGAKNKRFALNADTLKVPVISVGVPTVTMAETLVAGLTGKDESASLPEGGFLVAPGDVDLLISKSARAIGYGLNLALQGDMPVSDMEQLIS